MTTGQTTKAAGKIQKCIHFLQWALPQMHMHWTGFRRVHRQVCKRIYRRITELQLEDIRQYKDYIHRHPDEWKSLDSLCHISISRFYRDKFVFDSFGKHIFPYLCSKRLHQIRVCSLGCCSGEEPYTVRMIWDYYIQSSQELKIIAVDNDEKLIKRARIGRYPASSLKDLPKELQRFFSQSDKDFELREEIRKKIHFLNMDVRVNLPPGKFNIILCRNLVFTYYDDNLQATLLNQITKKIYPDGFLIIGMHEKLPSNSLSYKSFKNIKGVFLHTKNKLGNNN